MSLNCIQGRFWIDAKLLAELDAAAEEGMCSRSTLASELIRQGLSGRGGRPAGVPVDMAAIIGDVQRGLVLFRKEIVEGWRAVRVAVSRRRGSIDQATAKYLSRINRQTGKRITRATLYGWDARYRAAGVQGLIDGRNRSQVKRRSLLRIVERPSKTVRKTSKPGCIHARRAS
ncbi:MAG TPA: hypothetical protein VFE58_02330 [Tepidisphaeraceae bacterium]|jgi:hypothetical protein|nr:hypothetical protein [Tepidisphaeraceae bacterium]